MQTVTAPQSRWADVGLVALVSAFSALVSRRWSGFNSPDSEFYASLALFGSDITDRAIEPAYTWTRLGYIVPVRGLVTWLGPWTGFEVWRVLLIILIVASTFSVVRIAGRSRVLATGLSCLVALNTVVLAFLGNTYLTGSILAGTSALIALAVSQLGSAAHQGFGPVDTPRWTTAGLSGLLLGWLLMLNPYAFVLGLGLWVSVRLVTLVRIPRNRGQRLAVDTAAGITGVTVSVTGFLLAGRVVFPTLDWWGTYREWNSRLDYTVFIGDATVWQRDSALLVIVIALVASTIAAITHPRHRWAWAAFALATSNVVVTWIVMLVMPGPWLETPTYVAKLWPAALMALVLTFTSLSPGSREDKSSYPLATSIGLSIAVMVSLWAGRFSDVLQFSRAIAVAVVIAIFIVAASIVTKNLWNIAVSLLVTSAIGVTFVGSQLLQNGRGNLGIYGQYPFRSAFVDFNYRDQMHSKIAIQEWVLATTEDDDRLALWTDPERLTADVAAMQLWGGYNIFTTQATLDRESTQQLEELRPTVIVMYAPKQAQIDDFFATLPPWSLPTPLECTSQPYLGIGSGEVNVCTTRLTWIN